MARTQPERPGEPPARAALRTRNVDEAHAMAQRLMTRHRMDVIGDTRPFEARIDTDDCDGLGLMHFSFGAQVEVDSAPLEHFVAVHVPLAGTLRIEHRAQRVVADTHHAAVFSSRGAMALGWERGLQLLVLKIAEADLEQRLRLLLGEPVRRPLVFEVAAARNGAGTALMGVIDLVRQAFDAAGPSGPPAPVRTELKNMMISTLLLEHPHSYTRALYEPKPYRAPRAVRQAAELLEAAPSTTAQVARRVGVSERTLYEGFLRRFGLSPAAYSRKVRLERARAELIRRGTQDRVTVAEIALGHGFHHPSRFASLYRSTFGESPSQTLRQVTDHS